VRRANQPVGATAAWKARIRREVSSPDIGGNLLNEVLGVIELFRVPRGDLRGIVLQVMKHQSNGIPFEYLAGSQCVDAELKGFAGIGLLPGPAGFVVDDLDIARAQPVDLVDPANQDDVVFEWQFEALFLLQNLGPLRKDGCVKRL